MSSWKHYQQIRIIGRGSFGYVFWGRANVHVSRGFDPPLDFCPHTRPLIVSPPHTRRALLVQRRVDGKQLVVKQLPIHELSETDQTSAHQEVMVLSMLQHPSIIAYYDSFLENDVLNIVLEYADAGDLHDLIARAQQQPVGQQLLDEAFILDMFVQITLGIEHIHEKKILHRVWCQLPVLVSNWFHLIFVIFFIGFI
jgi:serine/threonine protein kinase